MNLTFDNERGGGGKLGWSLTAVHTNRTLQSLRKDGLITLAANRLTILDWNALAEFGDFSERYLHHSA